MKRVLSRLYRRPGIQTFKHLHLKQTLEQSNASGDIITELRPVLTVAINNRVLPYVIKNPAQATSSMITWTSTSHLRLEDRGEYRLDISAFFFLGKSLQLTSVQCSGGPSDTSRWHASALRSSSIFVILALNRSRDYQLVRLCYDIDYTVNGDMLPYY